MHIYCVRTVQIYECFCDETRLRILHLLGEGALCVCHFQKILCLPQTRVSQHLAYLRKRGMVESRRSGTWMVYSLPSEPSLQLVRHLQCLQDCVVSEKLYRDDLARLRKIKHSLPPALAEVCKC